MFWRWKSRNRAGRPKIDRELRDLIRRMSEENPLWGASRIHGALLMLGFEVAQSTVSKYMMRSPKPPSQSWKTFLRNQWHCGTSDWHIAPRMPRPKLIVGEAHLRQVLCIYAVYYNQTRTHLSLQKDAPLHRLVQRSGAIVAIPILAGLHHQYVRI
jgi:hypothetical protein